MHIVVTGATGNVGTAVVSALAADPQVDDVVGWARRDASAPPEGVSLEQVDVATDDLAARLRGADALVHLAWQFHPARRPAATWEANAVGTARLLDAAATAGVSSVVVASSVGAYSPTAAPDERADESWPTHSLATAGYGREKAYVERLLDGFEAGHPEVRTVRLRPAFVFQERAASEQRRIFAGPLLPGSLLRPGLLPVLPWPSGLRFQAVHADDLADAFRRAVVGDARGAFNVAAEPVIDGRVLADLLGSRAVEVPAAAARWALWGLWQLHLVPADPTLFDLVLGLPLLDTTRARTELGWEPRVSSTEAMQEVLAGMRGGAGGGTEPLAGDSAAGRLHEVTTGMGRRDR